MADTKLTDLTETTEPALTDYTYLVIDSGGTPVDRKSTLSSLLNLVDSENIAYIPSTITDWDDDTDPGNINDALDQLAERIDNIEVGSGILEISPSVKIILARSFR